MYTKQIAAWLAAALLLMAGCADVAQPPVSTVADTDTSVDVDFVEPTIETPDETMLEDEEEPSIPTTLAVGDPAPPFHYTEWLTGDELAEFEPGRIHVVEFWATWCGPCRTSMPHLSDLQEQYSSDVKFMGFSDESVEVVTAFLDKPSRSDESKTWSDIIRYSLALDEDRITHRSYLAATQQRGIPAAYIVGREGHLLWYGHPMMMDAPLAKIVANEWTRENAAEMHAEEKAAFERQMELEQRLQTAQREGDWDEAIAAFDELVSDPELSASMANQILTKRYELFSLAGRDEKAQDLADQIRSEMWDSAKDLNILAWVIANRFPETPVRNLDFALELANRANELTDKSDADVLSTVASVHFAMDDLDEAIAWQEKAVEHCDEGGPHGQRLEEYQRLRDEATSAASDEAGTAEDAVEPDESAEPMEGDATAAETENESDPVSEADDTSSADDEADDDKSDEDEADSEATSAGL